MKRFPADATMRALKTEHMALPMTHVLNVHHALTEFTLGARRIEKEDGKRIILIQLYNLLKNVES